MQKKKTRAYGLLFAATILLTVALYLTPHFIGASLTRVKIVQATVNNMKTTVSCTGTITSAKERELYYSLPLMAGKINVSVGQAVKAGQKLLAVDKQETIEAFSNNSAGGSAQEQAAAAAAAASGTAAAGNYNALLQNYQKSSGASQASAVSDVPETVVAPISGTVTDINAQQGSYTDPSQPVVVITDLSRLEIKAQVDEILISGVKTGQKVVISGDGFKGTYAGTVTKIYPTARQLISTSGTRTVVDVLISVENPGADLKPGLSTDVSIITANKPQTITVPYEAVGQDDDNREYAFVCKNGRAAKTYVKTGVEYQNAVEIVSGLKQGDAVILNPPENLKNAQRVRAEG